MGDFKSAFPARKSGIDAFVWSQSLGITHMPSKPTYNELIQTISTLKKEVEDCRRTSQMMGSETELAKANKRLQQEIDERLRIETALRESEARYRGLFENAPTSLWVEDLSLVKDYIDNLPRTDRTNLREYFNNHPEAVADCAGLVKIIDVNQTTLDLYRAASKEELMAGLDRVVPPNIYVDLIDQLVALAKGATRFEYEIVNQTLKGDKMHLMLRWFVAPGYEKSYSRVFLSLSDITERVLAEEALKESEAKFRTLTENSPNMIFINKQGKVVYTNKRCEEIIGYTRDEFYAPDFDFFTLIAPESMELVRSNLARHMEGEDLEPYEYTLVDKKGRKIAALITTKLIDYEGAQAILGIVTDISQRKQAEEALQESESKFRSFFDLSPQAVARIDFETGQMVDVNQKFCELFKLSKEEIFGRTMLELGLNSAQQSNQILKVLNKSGRVDGLEMNLNAKDGTLLTTLLFARKIPIRDDNSILIIFNDITERKKLEQQFQQAQRIEALGTLAGGIAHDFNNLLMGILGNASLMLSDLDSNDPCREQLKNIESYVHSAAELTHQLLDFARGGKYEIKPTNLNDLIERSAHMFGRTKKEINIHQKFQKDIWTVAIDQGQIHQMLLNLYVNAWQAMAKGGHLYIQTENITLSQTDVKPFAIVAGRYVKISITDTGVGMDEATQQRIFEPFFTTREKGRGTGLGLASAYGIINNHGGVIDVYSEKGKGSTFTIYLPVSDKAVALERDLDEKILKGQETVLLVDDEEMIIEIGEKMLAKMGYRPMIAKGGCEAIEVYRNNVDKIDLIILDMIMPDMNGQETFDNLKELNPAVKVLLSSGYSLNDQARMIMDSGCQGFVQKPFDAVNLSQKIRNILENTNT